MIIGIDLKALIDRIETKVTGPYLLRYLLASMLFLLVVGSGKRILSVGFLNLGARNIVRSAILYGLNFHVIEPDALAPGATQELGKTSVSFQTALTWDTRNQRAHYWLGLSYLLMNNEFSALEQLQDPARLMPMDLFAQYALGQTLLKIGRLDLALESWMEGNCEPILLHEAFSALSMDNLEQRDLTKAEQLFRIIVEIDPTGEEGNYGLGYVLFTLQRWDELIPFFQQAASSEKRKARDFLSLGDDLSFLQRWNEAERSYYNALAIANQPRDRAESLSGLANIIYHRDHNVIQAIELFQQAVEVEPRFEWGYLGLAGIYLDIGNNTKSCANYLKFLAINPNDPYALKQINTLPGCSLQRVNP